MDKNGIYTFEKHNANNLDDLKQTVNDLRENAIETEILSNFIEKATSLPNFVCFAENNYENNVIYSVKDVIEFHTQKQLLNLLYAVYYSNIYVSASHVVYTFFKNRCSFNSYPYIDFIIDFNDIDLHSNQKHILKSLNSVRGLLKKVIDSFIEGIYSNAYLEKKIGMVQNGKSYIIPLNTAFLVLLLASFNLNYSKPEFIDYFETDEYINSDELTIEPEDSSDKRIDATAPYIHYIPDIESLISDIQNYTKTLYPNNKGYYSLSLSPLSHYVHFLISTEELFKTRQAYYFSKVANPHNSFPSTKSKYANKLRDCYKISAEVYINFRRAFLSNNDIVKKCFTSAWDAPIDIFDILLQYHLSERADKEFALTDDIKTKVINEFISVISISPDYLLCNDISLSANLTSQITDTTNKLINSK
ncbi:MAG: hypothetical protein IJT96_12170 [Lachnospiraceae bacterium]|nr:hypothetical protein [Lachnospiraceae bacterium]